MNGILTASEINLDRYVRAKRAKEPAFADATLTAFRVMNGRYYATWERDGRSEQTHGTVGRLLEALERWAPQ